MGIQTLLGLNEDAAATLLWEDATYTPAGGSAQTIKINPKNPDALLDLGGTTVRSTTTQFQVRVSEVAAPAKGDTIVYPVGGTTFTIASPPTRNVRRRLWLIDTTT
jgi:hypothetical protein